jgi:xanthine dehydrogenase accessory factor
VGHGGKDEVEDSLVRLGKMLDFEVIVIDHSPVLSEQPDRLIKDPTFDIGKFDFSGNDSVVVLTHGEGDVETLRALSARKLRYVGMLASRRRVKETVDRLRALKVGEEFVSSLRSPAGADIGAVTAEEIALSIMAEITAAKYGRDVLRKSSAQDSKSPQIKG